MSSLAEDVPELFAGFGPVSLRPFEYRGRGGRLTALSYYAALVRRRVSAGRIAAP